MKKTLILATLLLVAFTSGLNAQQPAATDTEAYKELTIQLMKAINLEQTVDEMGQRLSQVFSAYPNMAEKYPEFMRRLSDELPALCVNIFPKYFTVQDMEQRIAYLNSPIGKKEAEATPHVMADFLELGQQIVADTEGFDSQASLVGRAYMAAIDKYLNATDFESTTLQQIGDDVPDQVKELIAPRLRDAAYIVYSKYFNLDEIIKSWHYL